MCGELRGEPGRLPEEKPWPKAERGSVRIVGGYPPGLGTGQAAGPVDLCRRAGRRAAVPEGKLCWVPVEPGQVQLVAGKGAGLDLLCNSCYPLLCAEQALD